MPRLILYVVVVAALVAGAVWLANDPGAVSLTWHGWRVETSVGILAISVIAIVAVLFWIARLLSIVGGTLQSMAAARRERRFKRGLASLGDGFAAVQAGQGPLAQKFAKEAGTLLSENPAVLMLRKDAAALSGDGDDMQAAARALLARPETELAGLRALANKALADGDVAGALTLAQQALARKDAPAWALNMTLDSEIAMERWGDALGALDGRLARETFSPAQLKRLKSRLLTLQAQAALNHGDAAGAAGTAKKAMESDETNSGAVVMFAKANAAQGKGRKAAGAVERAWAERPNAELLAAYRSLVAGESALDWARRVDGLAKAAPDHPESRLAVAGASLDAELWGQTRNRLSNLTGDDTAPEIRVRAAQLLAEVENRERGDSDKALQWLRRALELQKPPVRGAMKPKCVADILSQA